MKKHPGRAPEMPLPVVFSKSPANKEQTILTWFGHSTYLIQTAGLNLLVDPVFSSRASFSAYLGPKAYPMSADISLGDLPPIDIVILTHDHYDHLDYRTDRKSTRLNSSHYCSSRMPSSA